MSRLSENSSWLLSRFNQLLLPELDILPKWLEAVIYYLSVCVLVITSTLCSVFPFSSYPSVIAQLSGEALDGPLVFLPSVIAPLMILPGIVLFVLSQVFSRSRRSWLIVIALVASHFVLAGPILLGVAAALWTLIRKVGVIRFPSPPG